MSVEERIDVVDEQGAPTGIAKPKPDIHRDGDWHRSAHVWIVASDGRLLLQRRSAAKVNFPSRWDVSAAGHLSAGENAVEAAVRETREELGIELASGDLHHVATLRDRCVINDGTWIENEIHEVFVVFRDVDPAALQLAPDEVECVELVAPEDLPRYDPVARPEQVDAVLRWLRSR